LRALVTAVVSPSIKPNTTFTPQSTSVSIKTLQQFEPWIASFTVYRPILITNFFAFQKISATVVPRVTRAADASSTRK
jgi:hypothetical protein